MLLSSQTGAMPILPSRRRDVRCALLCGGASKEDTMKVLLGSLAVITLVFGWSCGGTTSLPNSPTSQDTSHRTLRPSDGDITEGEFRNKIRGVFLSQSSQAEQICKGLKGLTDDEVAAVYEDRTPIAGQPKTVPEDRVRVIAIEREECERV